MKSIGIGGEILFWITFFLKGRTQCVNVEGIKSSWKDVISGIPQGSVIGPILFVIFINDMPQEVVLNFTKLFADDCKLYGTVNRAPNVMQTDLKNLEEWSNKWQLPFNESKCEVLHFGYNNEKRDYTINDHRLEAVRYEKDLGVIIDDELKFHQQTATATKKANQILESSKNLTKLVTQRRYQHYTKLWQDLIWNTLIPSGDHFIKVI